LLKLARSRPMQNNFTLTLSASVRGL
jgi:hypothetical protein